MKLWLVSAAVLVILGMCVIIFAACSDGQKIDGAFGNDYNTNTYDINEDFTNISIISNTADISFVLTNGTCKVECFDRESLKHEVAVKNNTLTIELNDGRKWYEHIYTYGNGKIIVYLPEAEYGVLSINTDTSDIDIPKDFKFESIDLSLSTGDVNNCASASESIKIKTTTGKIKLANVSVRSLELSVSTGHISTSSIVCLDDMTVGVSTGKVYLKDISCRNLTSIGNTGDISLENVIVSDKMSIERTTGDVSLVRSDASEMFIITDTGDVAGSLLSEKIFIVKTDTGDVDVPKSTTGGRCEITTDTGDIEISIE